MSQEKTKMGEAWSAWVKTLRPEELEALKSAGINPDNYFEESVPMAHRYIYKDEFMDRHISSAVSKEEDGNGGIGALSSIIAKVIAAFDCEFEPKVMMNNDCVRIALGYGNYKSMADVAKKYGVSKATISWRVKKIQKRLGMSPSIYMMSEQSCQTLKRAANNRKK